MVKAGNPECKYSYFIHQESTCYGNRQEVFGYIVGLQYVFCRSSLMLNAKYIQTILGDLFRNNRSIGYKVKLDLRGKHENKAFISWIGI
jgi:hypothetical protein